MNRTLPLLKSLFLALIAAAGLCAPVHAAGWSTSVTVTETTTVMISIEDTLLDSDDFVTGAAAQDESARRARFVSPAHPAEASAPIASFGPFRVLSADTVEMRGSVDGTTPAAFRALLTAYPAVKTLRMVDCPGSDDDEANLKLARMVRARGMTTHVPDGGSVRSGAVDLFLAGATRRADKGAEFAVHSWRDEDGYEAGDYPANDPVHQEYLAYYRDIGMDAGEAKAFYALTNSVPFDDALWLGRDDLKRYVRIDG